MDKQDVRNIDENINNDFQNLIDHFSMIVVDKKDNEKIILKFDKGNIHYTLHFGTKSKILDVHKTTELPGGEKHYETLIKINHFTIGRVFICFKELIPVLFTHFSDSKINPGFLRKHKNIVQILDEEELMNTNLMNYHEKKQKLKFHKSYNIENLTKLFYSIDSNIKPAGYLVWRKKRGALTPNGLLVVIKDRQLNNNFFYISRKKYNAVAKMIFKKIIDSLDKMESSSRILMELQGIYSSIYLKNNV